MNRRNGRTLTPSHASGEGQPYSQGRALFTSIVEMGVFFKLHVLQIVGCKLQVLQIESVSNWKCFKLQVLQIACVSNCKCFKLQVLQTANIANCKCCKAKTRQLKNKVTYRQTKWHCHFLSCLSQLKKTEFKVWSKYVRFFVVDMFCCSCCQNPISAQHNLNCGWVLHENYFISPHHPPQTGTLLQILRAEIKDSENQPNLRKLS